VTDHKVTSALRATDDLFDLLTSQIYHSHCYIQQLRQLSPFYHFFELRLQCIVNVKLTIGRLYIYINLPVCDLVFSESQIAFKTDNRRTNNSHGDTQDGDTDSFLRGSLQYQQHGNVVIVTVKTLSLHHRPSAPVTLYCLLANCLSNATAPRR